MIRTIGNILWFLLGGLVMGLAWWCIGLLAFITIIGIPWGRSCLVIGQFTMWPFGREAIGRDVLRQREDVGTGLLGLLGNVIWFVFAGFWLAVAHIMMALALFLTIIGIPFGLQHLKLAGIALAPVGKTIVSSDVANVTRAR
ncbi:YccF domain-containing protein [Porticoccus sp.]|uniref:YccF domain-containing protein n=1 Tax=Porticoccus sp. TaxID=2024853 RepID=UPI003F6A2AD2